MKNIPSKKIILLELRFKKNWIWVRLDYDWLKYRNKFKEYWNLRWVSWEQILPFSFLHSIKIQSLYLTKYPQKTVKYKLTKELKSLRFHIYNVVLKIWGLRYSGFTMKMWRIPWQFLIRGERTFPLFATPKLYILSGVEQNSLILNKYEVVGIHHFWRSFGILLDPGISPSDR